MLTGEVTVAFAVDAATGLDVVVWLVAQRRPVPRINDANFSRAVFCSASAST
jgi:hypothetical protein